MAVNAPTLADAPAFDTVAAIACPLTRARVITALTRGCGTLRQPWVGLRRAALQEARDRHMTLDQIAAEVGLSPGRIWHLTKPAKTKGAAAGRPEAPAVAATTEGTPPMTNLTDLTKGQRFVLNGVRYELLTPASDHPHGFVSVRNLDMTDAQADALAATPGAVEPGADPRDGTFSFTTPVEVEVIA